MIGAGRERQSIIFTHADPNVSQTNDVHIQRITLTIMFWMIC